ncbi:response regulator [Pedobacter insulae]|uniref:Response regulator receiver domain-containing protein n=1 Tax=Pedobacter insulae TaxID=414048 RepID=A0A1I2ZR48_9SPHI|nr:response regulator [Pedobacter insulae]SFH40224.1 Response regulator receiver domain-containing protein [Pedobacter insulae]
MNKQKRITVADDDPGILDAVSMVLEMEGYEVSTTLNGNTVLTQAELPHVYILDIWMSGSDGRELCQKLKNDERTMHIPVILISASNDLKRSAETAGADDFLAKPFEIDALLQKIANVLTN